MQHVEIDRSPVAAAETVLFTGGCRSGKSSMARAWAEARGARRAYLASMRACPSAEDGEMRERILRHRADRGPTWSTLEADGLSPDAPLDAAAALVRASAMADVVVFDCVTLWVADWMGADADDGRVLLEADRFAEALRSSPVPVAVVTNEVGGGIVPDFASGRRFRDLVGFVNQRLARACAHVVLAVCGLPVRVK